jgi:hypothetical protein
MLHEVVPSLENMKLFHLKDNFPGAATSVKGWRYFGDIRYPLTHGKNAEELARLA